MTIATTLEKICALQPAYSSANTPEMKERGYLVRTELADHIKNRLSSLQQAFDPIFDDLAVESSDGIGRKTEAPWVRLFSKAMSPNPREGFYLVIHFAANGSATFITVGCGSTIWQSGDLRSLPVEELDRRTSWARSVLSRRWPVLDPFNDTIQLGAKAPLPRTFEQATAIAHRIDVDKLKQADIDQLLFQACERLNEIYLAQLDSRDLSPGDQDIEVMSSVLRPLRGGRRQGRGLNAADRKAVEQQAMLLATSHLESLGFECRDTSATQSFDILAKKDGSSIKIEVKGTTSDLCDSVLITKNELELHRRERGSTGLIIVSAIRLNREGQASVAEGGAVEALIGWDVDNWTLEPIAFQIFRPH